MRNPKCQRRDGRYRLGALLFVLITAIGSARAQDIILGALEDVPGVYAGEPNSFRVRILFHKNGADWQPFSTNCPYQECLKEITSTYPSRVKWTVAFDGKNLGNVTSRNPEKFDFYSHIGLQRLTGGPIPKVGARSAAYGGFTDAVVYRPLITNSEPYFSDPESWKPADASEDLNTLLRTAFRKRFPKLCKSSSDETKLLPFAYHDKDVVPVKLYASKTGWMLARLYLQGAIDCEDQEAGFEIEDAWFVIDPQKAIRFLDSGIWLVDAGDYDNDGKSEVVFSINRYNRGGYEIFYDDFKKHATFIFSYH